MYKLEIGKKTVAEYFKKFRSIVALNAETSGGTQIGGNREVVEIYECQVGRRKHHRGRIPREILAFGAIVGYSNPPVLFIDIVKKRNKKTLVPIIKRKIHAQSHIISDGWGAYEGLAHEGFTHSVINHSENFGSPADSSIHTQNIENTWRCLRRFLHSKGTYLRKDLINYIADFIFRKATFDCFEHMVSLIEMQYAINNNE